MAHKKAGGSTALGRDSVSKRLGVKVFGGQKVKAGGIIVKQKGNKFHAGQNVMQGRDFSLFSTIEGIVKFTTRKLPKFTGNFKETKFVNVMPLEK